MEPPPSLQNRVRDFIVNTLQTDHPYMKLEDAREAAKASVETLQKKLRDLEPTLKKTKERSGFMTLSAELRVLIYELALRPYNKGDGGIKGSRAIFIGTDDLADDGCYERWKAQGYRTTSWTEQPALTRLSRQVRCESLPVYYSNNYFVIEVGGCTLDEGVVHKRLERLRIKYTSDVRTFPPQRRALQWLHKLGEENVNMIKNLEILYSRPAKDRAAFAPSQSIPEYLTVRGIPLPERVKYLSTWFWPQDSDRPRQQSGCYKWYWYPLGLPPPAEPKLLPRPGEDSLAYCQCNRKYFNERKRKHKANDEVHRDTSTKKRKTTR